MTSSTGSTPTPAPSSSTGSQERLAIAAFLGAVLVACAGWQLMWFLTDDAYISFRYLSNALHGYGLVWNPPPFQPVEGYSNFLWIVLLGIVWSLTGVEPPEAANWLSLLLGLATLGLAAAWLWRGLEGTPGRWRPLLFAVSLLAIVTNRTFLTWLSSGLETALMNLLVLWWTYEAMRVGRLGAAGLPRLCLAAALMALTRPDGLGFWLATWVMVALVVGLGRPLARRSALLAGAALLVPVLHLFWRRATYGDWLPNTYYAKVIAPWPEMGLRYLASFGIEHAVWVWLLAVALAGVRWLRRGGLAGAGERPLAWIVPGLAIATLLAQVAYYVIMVGGDHFEYRIFSHLVPLLVLSLVFVLRAAGWQPRSQLAVLSSFWLLGLAIPWTHWWHTHRIDTREATHMLRVPIAEVFPAPLRPLVAYWDGLQDEMIGSYVGSRHQEHKVFHRFQVASHPPRERGSLLRWSDRHALVAGGVGVVGWTLPEVAVIDALGLNDRVIARAPIVVSDGGRRVMAHDRRGAVEYLQCFLPDLAYRRPGEKELTQPLLGEVVPGSLLRLGEKPRRGRLSDERIRACETRAWY